MEFKKYILRELADVDISSVDKKTKEGEKPVRLCNFTDVYKNWAIRSHIYDSFMKATAKQKDIEKFSIHKGQVAITKDSETRDDIGIPTYIADDFNDVVLGYHCALITPHRDFSGAYLNAYLNTKMAKKYFEGYASGSGQRYTLTLDSIKDIQIWAPKNKEDQDRIVKVLNDIDQKIILNTRMNAELEAMAKQLYDYWFVQFDFPDENGEPYKSSGGKMVWNEKLKREIPEGWDVKELDDLLDFSNGINYEKNIAGDKKYRIINVRNITSSSIFINKEDLDTIMLPSKQANNFLINEDDIIIARSGTPGSTRLIKNPIDIIYCGFIIKGSPQDKDNKFILMYFLKQLEGTQATKTGGSILQNVSQDTLKALLMIIPPKNLVISFNQCMDKIFESLNYNMETTNHLIHLRNSLLPMLMNGQVEIE